MNISYPTYQFPVNPLKHPNDFSYSTDWVFQKSFLTTFKLFDSKHPMRIRYQVLSRLYPNREDIKNLEYLKIEDLGKNLIRISTNNSARFVYGYVDMENSYIYEVFEKGNNVVMIDEFNYIVHEVVVIGRTPTTINVNLGDPNDYNNDYKFDSTTFKMTKGQAVYKIYPFISHKILPALWNRLEDFYRVFGDPNIDPKYYRKKLYELIERGDELMDLYTDLDESASALCKFLPIPKVD